MGLRQCLRASKLWVKAQVAKLRRRNPPPRSDDHDAPPPPRRHSEFFRRSRAADRQKTRSQTHPEASASRSRTYLDESVADASKPCAVCQRAFDPSKSKYLDFCSVACKSEAFKDRGDHEPTPTRLSEWI